MARGADNLPSDERVRRSDLLRVGMEEDWVGGRVARYGACEFSANRCVVRARSPHAKGENS